MPDKGLDYVIRGICIATDHADLASTHSQYNILAIMAIPAGILMISSRRPITRAAEGHQGDQKS